MKQIPLFDAPRIETDDLKPLAKKMQGLCYDVLRERGLQVPNAIWFVVEQNFIETWGALFEELEETGVITFLNISIGKSFIRCIENEMEVFVKVNENEMLLYSANEKDVFDEKYLSKIKQKLKAFIFSNAYQFNLD